MNKAETLGLIWMSAGNPYFTEQTIAKNIDFAIKKFSKVIIMAPDEPAEHTFRALGYEGNKAKKKARLNANLLQNRAKRIVESLSKELRAKVSVINWIKEILPDSTYKEKYKEILDLYKTNALFKKDARENTKKVISSKKSGIDLEKSIDEAVKYILEELTFILASPKIYKVAQVVYLYHTIWPIYQNLISGKYDGIKRENLRFLLVEN